MNYELFDDLIKIIDKPKIINNWLNNGYRDKMLMINGNNGLFKSSLSEHILTDYSVIKIDIEKCKVRFNFEEYISLSLEKLSIESLFFNKKKRIKALIIDDLNYILKTDKKLFSSISTWLLKMKTIKYPIICIVNDPDTNKIKKLLKKMNKIDIFLNDNEYYQLTQKYFINQELGLTMEKKDIEKLINKSNYNFNSIKINISYIENKHGIDNINKFLIQSRDNISLLKDLVNNYNDYDIDDILTKSIHDYNIISLNLIDNLVTITDDLEIIDDIYYNYIIYDNYYYNNNYYNNKTDIFLIYIIIYPIYLLRQNKITEMIYNKYICKSIIYIKNRSINNIKIIDLFYRLEKEINCESKNIYHKINENNEYTKTNINNILNNYTFFKDTVLTKKIIDKIMDDKNKFKYII